MQSFIQFVTYYHQWQRGALAPNPNPNPNPSFTGIGGRQLGATLPVYQREVYKIMNELNTFK